MICEISAPKGHSIFLVAYGEKLYKSIQNLSNLFVSFDLLDLANSDYCFCPLGRTDLFDLE